MTGCEFFGGKTESIDSLLAKDFPHCDPGLLYEMAVGMTGYCLCVFSVQSMTRLLPIPIFSFSFFFIAVTRSIIVTIFLVRIFQYVKGILGW